MKVAVIGSRGLTIDDLGKYLPKDTIEIVSGGTKGVDADAKRVCFVAQYKTYRIPTRLQEVRQRSSSV